MTIRQYILPILNWWWLLILAAAASGGTTYYLTKPLPPVYVARASLLVGRGVSDPNPTGNEISLSQQLAAAYADIANREPVQLATKTALNLTILPTYVAQADGAFIDISVTSSDPRLAQAVANELANQLISQGPATDQNTDPSRQTFINQQLDELQSQITQTKADIAAKQNALATLTSAVDIANTQNDITALQTRLAALETNYASLLGNSQQGAVNTLSLFEAALLPVKPIGPNKPLIIALAIASGLALGVGGAFLLEFLDNSLRTPEDVTGLLPYPVIGHISQMGRVKGGGVYVSAQPRSIVAEAFRSLRANVELAHVERPLKTLMVTSAGPGEGKSTIASNLALTIARSGKKVILVDADLRRPGLQRVFGLSNSSGLSDVLAGSLDVLNFVNPWNNEPNFGVVTTGASKNNATELLGSRRMDDVLARLQEVADVVVVDTAPFLVADSWLLASKVDAVMLVAQPGHTRKDAVQAMVQQIQRTGARVIGVVLNRIARQSVGYYNVQLSSYYLQLEEPRPRPALSTQQASRKRTQASLELLSAISQHLAANVSVHEQWSSILQLTVARMGATSGSLLVLNGQGVVVEGVVAYKGKVHDSATPQLSQVAEKGLASWVIGHREAVLIQNTAQDPRWLPRAGQTVGEASRAAISVPIIADRGVAGVLTLTHAQTNYFSDDDLSLLTAVSSCISLSGLPRNASQPADATGVTPPGSTPAALVPPAHAGAETAPLTTDA